VPLFWKAEPFDKIDKKKPLDNKRVDKKGRIIFKNFVITSSLDRFSE
jgi:hypothetical protein